MNKTKICSLKKYQACVIKKTREKEGSKNFNIKGVITIPKTEMSHNIPEMSQMSRTRFNWFYGQVLTNFEGIDNSYFMQAFQKIEKRQNCPNNFIRVVYSEYSKMKYIN